MSKVYTSDNVAAPAGVRHQQSKACVAEIATLTQPDRIYWADGSPEEFDRVCTEMVATGTEAGRWRAGRIHESGYEGLCQPGRNARRITAQLEDRRYEITHSLI
jgi:hypothetical protein